MVNKLLNEKGLRIVDALRTDTTGETEVNGKKCKYEVHSKSDGLTLKWEYKMNTSYK